MPSVRKIAPAVLLLAGAGLATPTLAVPLNPLAHASLGALSLDAGSYSLLTDGAAPTLRDGSNQLLATGWYVAQADAFNPQVAVFGFDSIQVALGATITAVGSHPLALLSRGGVQFAGLLDAAGRHGGQQNAGLGGRGGPGGGAGGTGGSDIGEPGAGPGGGAGGFGGLGNCSWGEGGAYGGGGGNWNPCRTAAAAYGNPALVLNGGSGGGASGPNLFGTGAGGGGGGGGVELGAVGQITLLGGTLLDVTGGNFGDGLAVNAGGGSGGGLLLHAQTISLLPDANGPVRLDASGYSGGRISFVTASGGVLGNTGSVSVGANFYGQVGVIDYGVPAAVPEPSTALLALVGAAGLMAWRRRPNAATSRTISGSPRSGARHGSAGASNTDGSPASTAC